MAAQAPTPSGPPPIPPLFAPPASELSALSASVTTALREYENATSPDAKALALHQINQFSSKLNAATTPLPDMFLNLCFGPEINVAVRIAIELNLFESIPLVPGSSISLSELAIKTGAEEEFLLRIIRTLVAFNYLNQDPEGGGLSHTQFSGFLTLKPAQAMVKHTLHEILYAHINSIEEGYYGKTGFRSPVDYRNAPFTAGFGLKDLDAFALLDHLGNGRMENFALAMTLTTMFGLDEVSAGFPYHDLVPNSDGVKLVDVGGGKGHFFVEMQAKHPELWTPGSLVLEDLKVVLDGGVLVSDTVKVVPYNFFEEKQPVIGSNYLFKHILHDWPDAACLTILSHTKSAILSSPTSRILICDLVLADVGASAVKTIRDMNMLCVGGKERSLSQWTKLLSTAGFKIVKVWGSTEGPSNIIEAVLA